MQCVEFKTELRDPEAARIQCMQLAGAAVATGEWVETYFRLHDGRLKRRQSRDEPVEWLFYHRLDRVRPKLCTFTILSDAQAQLRWGTVGLKPWVTIRKNRTLWMAGQIRLNIDHIDGLGWFIEFETLVGRRHTVIDAHRSIAALREQFAPVLGEAVSVSYGELYAQQQGAFPPSAR